MKIKEINNFNIIERMNLGYWDDNSLIDILYLSRSGNKITSPLLDITQDLDKVANILKSKYLDKWNKVKAALDATYELLDNVTEDITESVVSNNAETSEGSSTSSTSSTSNASGSSTGSIKSLGAASFQDKDRTADESTGTNSSSATGNSNSSTNSNGTTTRTYSRHGNIGVTSSQQMIEQEIKLREQNLIDIVFRDIDRELSIDTYGEE